MDILLQTQPVQHRVYFSIAKETAGPEYKDLADEFRALLKQRSNSSRQI